MDVLGIVLVIALILGSVYLTIIPFFSGEMPFSGSVKAEKESKDAQKEAIYITLNELEMEYKMGKVSESDYLSLSKKYEVALSKLMKETELQASSKQVDDNILKQVEKEIEAEIAKRKKGGN